MFVGKGRDGGRWCQSLFIMTKVLSKSTLGKIYFSSELSVLGTWLHHYGPVVRQSIMIEKGSWDRTVHLVTEAESE